MDEKFIRTQALLGKEAIEKLRTSRVAIFGIGGVGSYAVEVLARSGLGKFKLIDYDSIDISNINRQIHALESNVGLNKVDVMKDRILSINSEAEVEVYNLRYEEGMESLLALKDVDYVIDAIDTISSKLALISYCHREDIPIISAMGAGNKLNPTSIKVGDIYKTSICPLSRVMRRELRKREIPSLKVVWSDEEPVKLNLGDKDRRKAVPASVAFVPSVFGIVIGSEVIKDISLKEV